MRREGVAVDRNHEHAPPVRDLQEGADLAKRLERVLAGETVQVVDYDNDRLLHLHRCGRRDVRGQHHRAGRLYEQHGDDEYSRR